MTYQPPDPAELHRRTTAALREIGYPEVATRLDADGHAQALENVDPHDLWKARTLAGGHPLCFDHWLGIWRHWKPGDPVPDCDVHVPFLLVENCGRPLAPPS
jgi:hypothetical protein